LSTDVFANQEYLLRRQVLTLIGAKFQVFDPQGQLILFSQQKGWKLKEDIRVYADESMKTERLLIQARKIIDFSSAYDVVDSASGQKVGALRRKGLKSVLRDSWEFLDASDRVFAVIEEDSLFKALVRRFLLNFIPQSFHAKTGDQLLVSYKQNFNPFVFKLMVKLEPGAHQTLDPRLALAGAILLAAVEGRQG